MEEKDIIKLVQGLSKKLKDKQGRIADCEWHTSYLEQKELCDYVAVHSQLSKFPEKMMRNRAPNESDVEMQYRKDNFEPITMPYWYRALSSISGRVWSKQNHRITVTDSEISKYLFEDFPCTGSILEYFKSIVTPYKVNDANAVLAIKVGELPTVFNEATEETNIDSTAMPEVSLQIYGCSKLFAFKENQYALVLSDEKSEVDYNSRKEKAGLVFLLYDKDTIYRIKQVGKKIDWAFLSEPIYSHNLNSLPVWKLKGIPKQEIKDTQEDLVYYSYFIPAVPLLNKALKQDSSLDASISKVAFPIRTYYEDECDAPECSGGKIPGEYGENGTVSKYVSCPKCGGSGKGGIRFSPMKDHVLRPPKKTVTDEEVQLPFPAIAYVSPDTAILDFLEEKIKSEIIEAFTFINIDISNKGDNTGSQTGIEVKIDREELFAFLLQFSSECFDLLEKAMKAIVTVRFGEQKEKPFTIQPPKTFEIYSADELTIELGEAKKAGVPEIAIREMTKDYMAQRFSQQNGLSDIIDVVFKVDGYATKDTTEIAILKSNNLITLWQAILHEEIYQFIDQLSEEHDDFFEWKLSEQKAELEKLAKARAVELTPNTADNIVEELAGGGV